ncbi:MAG: acyl-CoA thioesterase [Lachnospiraceae bacterium]|nr:acyl-CoA thioesterase [Lachnospiraceae bacterium]
MEYYQHKVQYYETDTMKIVHHSNYIRWMEEARVAFLESIGWGYDRLEKDGVVSPVTAVECKYKVSTRFPEVIRIAVTVEEFKGVKLKLRYEMLNADDVVVFEGRSEHCFLDEKGNIVSLKRTYPELYEVFASLAAAQ